LARIDRRAATVVAVFLAACGDRVAYVLAPVDAGVDPCGMQTNEAPVAFCERFSAPSPATGRSGPLEGTRWSVARIGGNDNLGQGTFNAWSPSTLSACAGSQPAQPDGSDLVVCDGQLRESTNDNTGVTSLGLSVKQPFDFEGRTGTIAFDVTNDTSGSHGTWPELWITDEPVPAPFVFGVPCGICSFSRNAVGIRFSGAYGPFTGNQSPNCPSDANLRWIIDSMIIVRDYVVEQTGYAPYYGDLQTQGCVVSASGPDGPPNHIEVRVSQNQIEVWGTDPGGHDLTALTVLPDAGLTFTRGFLTLADVHNNASESPRPSTTVHTYSWSNVGFDGPFLHGMRSFDVADALVLRSDNTINLGRLSGPMSPVNVSTPAIAALDVETATDALLTFQLGPAPVATLGYSINGFAASASPPFPPDSPGMWHSVVVPVPVASLAPGSQSISVTTDQPVTVTNVSVILEGTVPQGDRFGVTCESGAPGTLGTILLLLTCLRLRRPRRDF
jgi:hypothetical protein